MPQPATPRLVRRRRRLTDAAWGRPRPPPCRRAAPRPADRRMRNLFGTRAGSGTLWPSSSACSSRPRCTCRALTSARPGPAAARVRAAGRSVGEARPDAGAALRPPAGRLLRRAVRAAQPGRAVQLRRGPAGSSARSSAPSRRSCSPPSSDVVRAASIGQVHRATLHNGDRVAVKVQRPRIREILQADIRAHVQRDLAARLDRGCSAGQEPRGHRRVRAVDRGRDRLPGRGRQAVLLHDHAKGDRYEHIARVYRDYTTSRVLTTELIEGIPLIEVMVAQRDGDQAYLDAARGGRPRPRPDRAPARLEHAQPGVRVRLLPRRPASGEHLRARGRRHRLRGLRHRRPAPEPDPAVAHPLQLAAVPGRDRGRGHRAHALARADAPDRRNRRLDGG